MALLEIEDLQKTFGGNRVVQDFNLAVEKGEFVSFLGPSGCGKTTTLRMVAGFEQPDSGRIVIGGKDVTALRANQRALLKVFLAATFLLLVASLTVIGTLISDLLLAALDPRIRLGASIEK